MRGRPKKDISEKSELMTITIPAGFKNQLKGLNINKSQICAKALKRALKKVSTTKDSAEMV